MRRSAILVFVLSSVILEGFCCNVQMKPRNRAKIVEDYILSAKFNDRKDVPQLGNQLRDVLPERKDASQLLPFYKDDRDFISDADDGSSLENRDLLVHHHHVPPLPHPPPPPPVGLALGPSMFAMGLIAFLILLNGLSSQLLMIVKTKSGLLGTGTNVLGKKRRRRSNSADDSRYTLSGRLFKSTR